MRYAQDYHVVPLVLLSATTTAALPFVNMSNYLWCDFLMGFGTISADSIDVTVEVCTANSTSGGAVEVAIPFRYKAYSAVGTDAVGALTTADSLGIGLDSAAGEGLSYIFGVDPKDLPEGYNYVRVNVAQQASTDGLVMQAYALLTPRYAADTMISSS